MPTLRRFYAMLIKVLFLLSCKVENPADILLDLVSGYDSAIDYYITD